MSTPQVLGFLAVIEKRNHPEKKSNVSSRGQSLAAQYNIWIECFSMYLGERNKRGLDFIVEADSGKECPTFFFLFLLGPRYEID